MKATNVLQIPVVCFSRSVGTNVSASLFNVLVHNPYDFSIEVA